MKSWVEVRRITRSEKNWCELTRGEEDLAEVRRVGKKYDEVKRGELKWEEVKKHRAVEKTCEKREGLRSGGRSWKRGRQREDEFREQLWGFTSFPIGKPYPSPLWWNILAARNVCSQPGAGMCRFYLYILYMPRSKIFPLTLKHVETLYHNFSMFQNFVLMFRTAYHHYPSVMLRPKVLVR